MSFAVTYNVKQLFFDRPAVRKAVGRKKAKVLSRAGAFLRRRARSKLRRRKKTSAAGTPPSVHSRDTIANLRNILFAFDGKDSVICGPVGLNNYNVVDGNLQSDTVPETLEFGGKVGIREKWRPFSRAAAIAMWGPVDGDEYVREHGVLPEAVAQQIYGEEFSKRASAGGMWVPVGRKRRNRWATRVRTANYEARPWMGPSLVEEAPNFPDLFQGSLS